MAAGGVGDVGRLQVNLCIEIDIDDNEVYTSEEVHPKFTACCELLLLSTNIIVQVERSFLCLSILRKSHCLHYIIMSYPHLQYRV